jgi:hypothetical protein
MFSFAVKIYQWPGLCLFKKYCPDKVLSVNYGPKLIRKIDPAGLCRHDEPDRRVRGAGHGPRGPDFGAKVSALLRHLVQGQRRGEAVSCGSQGLPL